jgi:hypothetical protein
VLNQDDLSAVLANNGPQHSRFFALHYAGESLRWRSRLAGLRIDEWD